MPVILFFRKMPEAKFKWKKRVMIEERKVKLSYKGGINTV